MGKEVSATKLLTFAQCPYLYWLKYELKIKVPVSIHLVFGQAIHQLIASFYRLSLTQRIKRMENGQTVLFPKTKESAIKLWINFFEDVLKEERSKRFHQPTKIRFLAQTEEEIAQEQERWKLKGISIIAKYWEDNKDAPFPVAIEKRFCVPAPGRTDIKIVGSIDQIREVPPGSGNFYLVDLKTGWDYGQKDPRIQYPVHHDYQFTIYSFAFRMLYGKEEAGIIRYPLGWKKINPIGERIDKRLLITPRSEYHYLELSKLIELFLLATQHQIFPKITKDACRFCDYLEICAHPELITTEPISVKEFDWGRPPTIEILRKQLEEAKEMRALVSQPRLL